MITKDERLLVNCQFTGKKEALEYAKNNGITEATLVKCQPIDLTVFFPTGEQIYGQFLSNYEKEHGRDGNLSKPTTKQLNTLRNDMEKCISKWLKKEKIESQLTEIVKEVKI